MNNPDPTRTTDEEVDYALLDLTKEYTARLDEAWGVRDLNAVRQTKAVIHCLITLDKSITKARKSVS